MLRLPLAAALTLVVATGLVCAGCGSDGGRSGPSDQAVNTPAGPPSAAATNDQKPSELTATGKASPPAQETPPKEVTLRVADLRVYQEVLAKHKGKPILVDFWATWCVPCIEQFPHTVELHTKHAAAGLAVVSVSLDDPADEVKVRTFLEKQGATFDNLLSKWGGDGPSFENFDIRGGAVPHYKLYDRDGQLRQTFSVDPAAKRQFTPADIERSVLDLLRPSSS